MRDALHLFGDPRVPDRLWSRIDVAPCGCWIWARGEVDRDGYPNPVRVDGRRVRPHRLFRVKLVGPIAPGLHAGHQCHSLNLDTCPGGLLCVHRRCVNPLDVEPETVRANLLGGHTLQRRNSLVEHCPQRHWYTAENTIMVGKSKSSRGCRKCYRNSWRRRHGKPESTIEGPDF